MLPTVFHKSIATEIFTDHCLNPDHAFGERRESKKHKKIKWSGNFGIAPPW